jgi:hypothetical protein
VRAVQKGCSSKNLIGGNMAQKILQELSDAEKLVVQSLRIAVLKSESSMTSLKTKFEADFKTAQTDLQNNGNALMNKLRALATDLKLDLQKTQFEMDKLYFYENIAVTDVKDAVKKAETAIDGEINKVETAVKTVAGKMVAGVKKAL